MFSYIKISRLSTYLIGFTKKPGKTLCSGSEPTKLLPKSLPTPTRTTRTILFACQYEETII